MQIYNKLSGGRQGASYRNGPYFMLHEAQPNSMCVHVQLVKPVPNSLVFNVSRNSLYLNKCREL